MSGSGLSASIEDYIKAIYALEIEDRRGTTKRIAQRLEVRMASVTGMIKHLAAEGYVRHVPYRGVQMTEKGRKIALRMIRRHRIIELFLSRTLGLGWDEVDADAEVLEHAVSDRLVERIYEYLGCPQFDPHGSPIPGKDGSIAPRRGVPLNQLAAGNRGAVVEVSDSDPDFLRYLTQLGLKIGTVVRVRECAPFDGPITAEFGRKTIALGKEACSRIRVAVEPPAARRPHRPHQPNRP